jgi:hypothetical protein
VTSARAKTSCKQGMYVACARSKTVFANFAARSTLLALCARDIYPRRVVRSHTKQHCWGTSSADATSSAMDVPDRVAMSRMAPCLLAGCNENRPSFSIGSTAARGGRRAGRGDDDSGQHRVDRLADGFRSQSLSAIRFALAFNSFFVIASWAESTALVTALRAWRSETRLAMRASSVVPAGRASASCARTESSCLVSLLGQRLTGTSRGSFRVLLQKTGATGLEPATSGVTDHFETHDG